MKVIELEGDALDFWVARAERIEHPRAMREMAMGFVMVPYESEDDEGPITRYRAFEPSSSWADGGPLIEREHGAIGPEYQGSDDPVIYFARMGRGVNRYQAFGPTPLVAAMRAFVAFKFGAEVPEE
jgi:hypothetical protein